MAESDAAKLALNQKVAMAIDRNFSIRLDDWSPTDQKSSGRCWLFAATNLLRAGLIKKLKLKSFEFSQNWLMFWDKLEKANYFLEAMIETADRDLDDRTVVTIIGNCVNDGGQWNMFVNIALKYGLVPKAAMPETLSSSSTGEHEPCADRPAARGREAAARHDPRHRIPRRTSARQRKRSWPTCTPSSALHLGNPPERFDWQWTDDKKKFHRRKGMTPKSFFKEFVSVPLQDYVCLVHDPRKTSPVGRTFTVEYLGNVVEGGIVTYLNVDIATMKEMAMKALKAKEPVWFGCDCSKMMHRDLTVWDARMFDFEGLYGTAAGAALQGGSPAVQADRHEPRDALHRRGRGEGKPKKWRVENSWGEKGEGKGFYVMNDSWFDEHMFEIAARRSRLPASLRAALERRPSSCPPGTPWAPWRSESMEANDKWPPKWNDTSFTTPTRRSRRSPRGTRRSGPRRPRSS